MAGLGFGAGVWQIAPSGGKPESVVTGKFVFTHRRRPQTTPRLSKISPERENRSLVAISAADPFNLTGTFSNRILYRHGVPIAVKKGKEN